MLAWVRKLIFTLSFNFHQTQWYRFSYCCHITIKENKRLSCMLKVTKVNYVRVR